jgi:hypothetical protein
MILQVPTWTTIHAMVPFDSVRLREPLLLSDRREVREQRLALVGLLDTTPLERLVHEVQQRVNGRRRHRS